MRRGFGTGLGRRTPFYDFTAEADAYFAAMAVQPNLARKSRINDLIAGLKSDGIWPRLDWLSLFASHDAQAARLNAKNPAQAFNVVNTPTFTTDLGYASVFASTSYLNSGWDPATNGVQFQQNSAHMAVWVNAHGSSSGRPLGTSNAWINPGESGAAGGLFTVQANGGSITGPSLATRLGLSAWDRSASNAGKLFRGGAAVHSFATASAARSSFDIFAGAYNNSGTPGVSPSRLAAVCWGAHLTDAEHLALYSRLNTFLAAIGAA